MTESEKYTQLICTIIMWKLTELYAAISLPLIFQVYFSCTRYRIHRGHDTTGY